MTSPGSESGKGTSEDLVLVKGLHLLSGPPAQATWANCCQINLLKHLDHMAQEP